MSDETESIERKLEELKAGGRLQPSYSSRYNALILAREKAQEREFKASLRRRAKLAEEKK